MSNTYTGSAVAVKKQISVGLPDGAVVQPDAEVKIGLGDHLLTFTGWDAAAIVSAWSAASGDAILSEIVCTLQTGGDLEDALNFTHKKAGEDFEITVLIDGVPLAPASVIQTIELHNSPTGGTFIVFYVLNGDTKATTGIAITNGDSTVTATTMQTRLNAIAGNQAGDFIVTAYGNTATENKFRIELSGGQYAGKSFPILQVNPAAATGGTAAVVITRITTGAVGQDCIQSIELVATETTTVVNEEQTVVLGGATFTGGTFTLTYDGQTTGTIAYNATAAQVKTALVALSNIGANDIVCTGGPLPYRKVTVEFTDALSGMNVVEMTGNGASLTFSDDIPLSIEETQEGNDTTVPEILDTPNAYQSTSTALYSLAWQWSMQSRAAADGPVEFTTVPPTHDYTISGNALYTASLPANSAAADILALLFSARPKYKHTDANFLPVIYAAPTIVGVTSGEMHQWAKYGPPMVPIHADDVTMTRVEGSTYQAYTINWGANRFRKEDITAWSSPIRNPAYLWIKAGATETPLRMSQTYEQGGVDQTMVIAPTSPLPTTGNITFTRDAIDSDPVPLNAVITPEILSAAINPGFLQDIDYPDYVALQLDDWALQETSYGSYYPWQPQDTPPAAVVLAYPVLEADLTAAGVPLTVTGTDRYLVRWRQFFQWGCISMGTWPTDVGIPTGGTYAAFAANINAAVQAIFNPNVTVTPLGGKVKNPFIFAGGSSIDPSDGSGFISVVSWGDGQQYADNDIFTVTYDGDYDPTGAVTIDTETDGNTTTLPDVSGGTITINIDPPNDSPFAVSGIDWDASAAEVQTAINAVMGANSVTCDGGPFPSAAIEVHFSGNGYNKLPIPLMIVDTALSGTFPGSYNNSILRTAHRAAPTTNTWELTVIPGEGTPGVNFEDDPLKNVFRLKIVIAEGALITEPGVSGLPDTSAIEIRFCGLNAAMIESIINEAFGKDVCRVTRIVHSPEHKIIGISGYGEAGKGLAGWYYRDVYRITFVNDYATPGTIIGIELTMADGTAQGDPANFMVLNRGGNYDDLTDESGRIAYLFYYADLNGEPIQRFTISFRGDEAPETLTWAYKLLSQYVLGNATVNLNRIGIADQLADLKIRFQWCKYVWGSEGTGYETKSYTPILQTPLLDWDSPPEVIRYALERMAFSSGNTPEFFKPGNVVVTGSLFNSWLADPYQGFGNDLSPDPEEIEYDVAYHDLKVALIGVLDHMPLNEYNYELRLITSNPYGWSLDVADNDVAGTNRFKGPLVWSDIIAKPLPLLRNERQRLSINEPDEDLDDALLAFGDDSIALDMDASAASIETAINAVLGQFNTTGIQTNGITTIPDIWIPEKLRKSVCVFGNTLRLDPMEFEFSGYGYHYADPGFDMSITLPNSPAGIVTVTMDQVGIAAAHDVQSVALSGGPTSGTFRLVYEGQTTADIQYNADAATVSAALIALSNIGPGEVVVTGGPLPAAVTCTFDDALIPSDLMTSSNVALNGLITSTVTVVQEGGLDGTLTILELVRGAGPSFWDAPRNWSTGIVPSSEETVIINDAKTPLLYGIRQHGEFVVVGSDGKILMVNRRCTFVDGQKVYALSDDTLPTGLTEGYYYILNSANDATLYLWDGVTLDGDDEPAPVVMTGQGVGTHTLQIREVDLQVFARYGGKQIGLPVRRANGLLEYLSVYLSMGMTTIQLGTEAGDGLSLGKFDTLNLPSTITVVKTGSSTDTTIPAVLFLTDHEDTTLYQTNGSVGVSVYPGETSHLKSIVIMAGVLSLRNVTVDETLTAPPNVTIIVGGTSTIGQRINIGV